MYKKLFELYFKKTDPELAHKFAINIIKNPLLLKNPFIQDNFKNLNQKLFNLHFKNPIGLAAGFDKNGEIYNKVGKLGFGFTEVGTVTPEPQFGNQKPRVFRLTEDQAIINRLGFPNDGMFEIKRRMENSLPMGICGVNIGPNKQNAHDSADFLKCFEQFFNITSYITVNISSPNTPKLRLQHKRENIKKLIEELHIKRDSLSSKIPILFKISPDINILEVEELSKVFLESSIDGLILTNTSIYNKDKLNSLNRIEEGGLSGPPIENTSNLLIQEFYKNIGKKIPIIGVGGIRDGKSAFEKIKSGASLLQLYTSMIYEGPFVANKINRELSLILKEKGIENISSAIGLNCN